MNVGAGRVQAQTLKLWTQVDSDQVRVLEVM